MQETKKTVCVVTFGCQMNKLDSQLLRGELLRSGFDLTEKPDSADVVLYNTCSVRQHAEDKVMSHLGAHRRRAESDDGFVVGVIGCMAQRLGDELQRRFDFIRLVCGTRAFLRVPAHLKQIMADGRRIVDLEADGRISCQRMPAMRTGPHRAYVSVMRGCDNFCTYCIVPYVRGREVSRPLEEVMAEVEALADDGVREVVLLGQNVNSYGRGLPGGVTLADVLRKVNEVEGLWRVRFVTSHPRDMSEGIIRAVAELDKVCNHLHVPAQSGSDAVLKRMGRGYTSGQYREMVRKAREAMPDVAVASDFMVGFPGETDADFDDTLRLVQEVGFQQSFVFKYSPRPGTRAAQWADDVPDEVKRERNQSLLQAQEAVDTARRAAMIGSVVEVLVDGVSKGDASKLTGRTPQNDIVAVQGGEERVGRLCRVRITDATPLTLFGAVEDEA